MKARNVEITNCQVSRFKIGIQAVNADGLRILGNTFVGNTKSAIYISNSPNVLVS